MVHLSHSICSADFAQMLRVDGGWMGTWSTIHPAFAGRMVSRWWVDGEDGGWIVGGCMDGWVDVCMVHHSPGIRRIDGGRMVMDGGGC